MNRRTLATFATAAATLAVAACEREPVIINKFDAQAEELKNAGTVAPPPMIQASRTYRCRDNSLVYIDFYTNDTAAVRTEQGGIPVATLTAEGGNPPYRAEGYSVSANAAQISYSSPRGTLSCRSRT